MLGFADDGTLFIVLTVLLFMLLGIAILVMIDAKAQIPGQFGGHLLSIKGMRREHPFISFLTTLILLAIIAALLFELGVTLGAQFGLFVEKEPPKLVQELRELRVTERNRHFHNEPVEEKVIQGKKSVCFSCHGDFPHSKEVMIRTLLNMHTQFIGCMTCHNNPEKVDEESLSFAWLNFSGIEVNGKPFGTDIDPSSGYLLETDDYYSKIVAYSETENGKELLDIPEMDQKAQEYLALKDQLSDRDREAVKKSFHKKVSPKGRFCSRCHTREEESYLPLSKLGFSEFRIDNLTNLNIIGLVQKYKKFYLPNLFESEIPLPDIKSLVGGDKADEAESETEEDPRAWWRRTFDAPGEGN